MRREFSKEPPMFSKPAGYVEAVDKNANKDMWGDIKLLENKYIKESGSSKPNPEATRSNPDLNSEFNGEKNATRLHSSVVSGTVGLSAQSKLNFGGAARFKTAGSGVPNYNPLILNNVQNAAFIGMKAPVNKRPSLHSDNEIAKTSSSPTSLNSSKSAMESNASEVGNISSKPEFAEENSSEKAGAHNLASDTSKDHKVNENKSSFDRPPLPTLPRVKPWSASTNSPMSGMSKNMNLEQVTAGVTENPTTTNVKKTSTQAQSVRHDLAKTRNRTSLMDSESPMDEKNLSVKYKLAILDKLVDEMFKFREIHTKINHDLIQDCSELSNSNAIIEMEKKEMVSIADRVDKKIHVLKKQLESLETQYATAQMKCEYLSNTNKLEPENFFGGTTPIQDQLLSVSSEIHALDDAIYYLGKALDVERIDLQTYLKNVRKLSQQQFLAKALANKLRKMANLNIG
ncbi:Tumor susceptibility gene protein [Zancudomyces culisetae]|uniref:Tumor susceptibility gene protein n=1 Tax=Zancudomyces culisetae TaxID=1213189 RepID=A0A1R1PGD5_ZANCU|nr:Tumor susceptibility gene protein [Zancudomyces culisetae]|eukprot:OMH80036.1 Tumor susceptibility gene protein [Zancudomyces culisetae]